MPESDGVSSFLSDDAFDGVKYLWYSSSTRFIFFRE
jgi:hypothetical protein